MLVECNDLSNLTSNVTAIYVHSSDIAWNMTDKNVVGVILTDNRKEWAAIVKTGKQVYIHPGDDVITAIQLADYMWYSGRLCYMLLNEEWVEWSWYAKCKLALRRHIPWIDTLSA